MGENQKLECPIEVRKGGGDQRVLGYAKTESELRQLILDGRTDHFILTFREDCAERHGRVDIVIWFEGGFDDSDDDSEDTELWFVKKRLPTNQLSQDAEPKMESFGARRSTVSTEWHPDSYTQAVIYGALGGILKACDFTFDEAISTAFSYFTDTDPPEGIIWEKGLVPHISYSQFVIIQRHFKDEQTDAVEP